MTSGVLSFSLTNLSDTQFELLLRNYLRRQQSRMGKAETITFTIRQDAYQDDEKRGFWTVGARYDSHTKGEILSETITEYNRRCGFTSTLLQLTTDVVDTEVEEEKKW